MRRLFTALAALSALLCVAVLALWARSHRRADYIAHEVVTGTPFDGTDTITAFRFNLGELQFSQQTTEFHQGGAPYPDNSLAWSHFTFPPDPRTLSRNQPTMFHFAGLAFGSYDKPIERTPDGLRTVHQLIVSIPHWLLGAVLALPASVWWRRRRTAARNRPEYAEVRPHRE